MPIDQTWLAQVDEPVLDPDLPIVDPHHHLWDYPESRYLGEELQADIGGHNVVATVFVECGWSYRTTGMEALRPVGETDYVESLALGHKGRTRIAAGIVGFADLTLGAAAREVLTAHIATSPGRFRGIRHAAGWHASPDIRNSHSNPPAELLSSASFREGFAELAPLGLTFDAWLFHTQIDELTALARAFPETTIVLDHFGGPLGIGPFARRSDEVFTSWQQSIDELARCENVVAKLGGLNMALNGFGWHKRERPPTSEQLATATRRYYLHTIDRFGVERCMFESNFPVDKLSCSYNVIWNSFKRIAADCTPAEKAALFEATAKRVYRL
jgi:L-fuconolactonase